MTVTVECAKVLAPSLESFVRVRQTDSGCVVTTSTMYPSGRVVQVFIDRDGDHFRLSDGAQALREMRQAGIELQKPGVYIAPAARRRGVAYTRGEVFADVEEEGSLPILIKLVANASNDAVVSALESHRLPRLRSFKFAFNSYMKDTFGGKFKPDTVAGELDKYKLDYVHRNGKLVIADPITADTMSVDRAFRIHSDIHSSRAKGLSQWLIYDEGDPWKKTDLAVLRKTGAIVAPYEKARKELPQAVR